MIYIRKGASQEEAIRSRLRARHGSRYEFPAIRMTDQEFQVFQLTGSYTRVVQVLVLILAPVIITREVAHGRLGSSRRSARDRKSRRRNVTHVFCVSAKN